MASEYVRNYKYVDVFTGKKYSPDHPLFRIMQTTQQQQQRRANSGAPQRTVRNLDLNSGPSTFAGVVDHHVDLLRETHQRSRPGRTYRRPRRPRVEENPNFPIGNFRRSCPQTMATVAMVVQRRTGKTYKPGSKRFLYDRIANDYEWLPSGWLCEERIMETGRIYRYYYCPKGYLYGSKLQALGAMFLME